MRCAHVLWYLPHRSPCDRFGTGNWQPSSTHHPMGPLCTLSIVYMAHDQELVNGAEAARVVGVPSAKGAEVWVGVGEEVA